MSDQIGEKAFTLEESEQMLKAVEAKEIEGKRLAAMPEWLRAIAERHTLPLFDLCFNSLAATERLSIMASKIRAADAQSNLQVIAQSMNNIANVGLNAMGKSMSDFRECLADIQRACALAAGPDTTSARSAGGIILPH